MEMYWSRCTTRNELLRRERRSEVNLTVVEGSGTSGLSPPVYLNTFPTASNILLEEDENLQLDCIAYGVPLPSITWVFTFLYGKPETGERKTDRAILWSNLSEWCDRQAHKNMNLHFFRRK